VLHAVGIVTGVLVIIRAEEPGPERSLASAVARHGVRGAGRLIVDVDLATLEPFVRQRLCHALRFAAVLEQADDGL
jgi:hypothetical protein